MPHIEEAFPGQIAVGSKLRVIQPFKVPRRISHAIFGNKACGWGSPSHNHNSAMYSAFRNTFWRQQLLHDFIAGLNDENRFRNFRWTKTFLSKVNRKLFLAREDCVKLYSLRIDSAIKISSPKWLLYTYQFRCRFPFILNFPFQKFLGLKSPTVCSRQLRGKHRNLMTCDALLSFVTE